MPDAERGSRRRRRGATVVFAGPPEGLLRAVETVVGEIELPVVLRRVVEAAVELVDAEYGALGIIAADRSSLDQFIHVGLSTEDADAIGHLPAVAVCSAR